MGFTLLHDLVKSKKNNYFIFTSNVDGHFQKAGFVEEKIYEIHGSIEYIGCKPTKGFPPIWKEQLQPYKNAMLMLMKTYYNICHH